MLRIDVDSLPSTLLTIGKALEVVVCGCVVEPDFRETDRIEFKQLVCNGVELRPIFLGKGQPS